MADMENELCGEIARIVACPYPPSLTKLADILSRAEQIVVRTCMHNQPPLAVIKLVIVVSAALPHWAYTLDILKVLCHSSDFRDKLLLHTPGLLDALLAKAISTQRDSDDYTELGVLLLSHSLPEPVPLPASAQPFFLHLFGKAVQAPDVTTLRPIYCMLNGACRDLLSILSPDARHSFDKELCHILSSNSTGQDSMLLLWCFGIIILAEHPHHVGVGRIRSSLSSSVTTGTPNLTPERQWKTASGRKLFGSSNGIYKAINLTYLSVIWASKGEVVPDSEAVEGIKIATRTLEYVDSEMREGWPSSSAPAKYTYPKLPVKILRKGIDLGVQFEALCFYALIAGKNNIQPDIVEQYEAILAHVSNLHTDTGSLRESLAISLPFFAPQFGESGIRDLMSRILNMSVRPIPSQLANFTVLVEELAVVIPSCATLRSKVLLVLSSNGIQDDIQCFLRVPGGAQCGDPLTALLHRNLVTATISMLLTAALTVQSAEPALPHSLAIALVSKQQKLTNIAIHDVPMAPPNAQPSISLFEQECTPSTGRPLEDWRNRLKSELESQSFYQRDSVIRSVAQICQELEIRCETVEEPLRIEKSKSEALTTRVSQLHNRVLTLESEAVDRRLYIDGLEAEIGSAENEKNNIATKLEDLRTQFSSANRKADETLRVAQEDFSALELQYRSTTLTREEDMELLKVERDQLASEVQRKESENMTLRQVHKEQIGDLNREQNRLSEEVQRIKDEKLSLSEVHENLESDFSNLKCGLEAERNTVSQQARELDILMGKGTEVEQCLRSTEAELETVNNQLSELQSRHGEHVRSSEEALRDLEARHKNDIEVATNKANKEYKHLSDELQDAIHDTKQATNAYEDSRRETQLLQTTINSLETNIQQLNDVCSKKDEELEELRTLRSRVLASMGLAAEPSLIRTGLHSNNVANDLRIPKQHRRRKSAIQTQDVAPKGTLSMQGITNLAMETVANAPFTSSDSSRDGSSPKRARARSSFKVPTMHVPNSYADGYQSQSISKKLSSSKRSALRQLSPNRRHTSVGFGVLEKGYGDEDERKEVHDLEKRRGSLCDIEGTMQASFDMDGFLASSTPFTPNNFACGTGRGPEEEELTTEL